MPRNSEISDSLRKIEQAMFSPIPVTLTTKQQELKAQLSRIYTYYLDKPYHTDTQMRQWIMNELQVDKTKSIRLLSYTKRLLGNVQLASKVWRRHQTAEMFMITFNMALKEGDIKGMLGAVNGLAKYCMLDKDDEDINRFDEADVPDFEMTGDVSVLGLKKIENLEAFKAYLRKKYDGEIEDAQIINDGEKG